MPKSMHWKALEEKIGYSFKKRENLELALTHCSYLHDHEAHGHNERLEFLGDAILSAVLTEQLYSLYYESPEGSLARYRSILIRGSFLAELALQMSLNSYIRMSALEIKDGGQEKPAALEDALEALIGAIYLDSDYATVKKVIIQWYGDIEVHLSRNLQLENPKGKLQELLWQKDSSANIEYRLIDELGPAHGRHFKVCVTLDQKILGHGEGSSKKAAEEQAATEALKHFSATGKSG